MLSVINPCKYGACTMLEPVHLYYLSCNIIIFLFSIISNNFSVQSLRFCFLVCNQSVFLSAHRPKRFCFLVRGILYYFFFIISSIFNYLGFIVVRYPKRFRFLLRGERLFYFIFYFFFKIFIPFSWTPHELSMLYLWSIYESSPNLFTNLSEYSLFCSFIDY